MTAHKPPILFNRKRLRARKDRIAKNFSQFGFLHHTAAYALLDRLDDHTHAFERCLDLGSHDGYLALQLAADNDRFVIAANLSERFAGQCIGKDIPSVVFDEEAACFAPQSFDLVTSALSLHWANDLPGSLVQIRNMLKPDGLLLAALFGGGTLTELRSCLLQAESELTSGAAQRISPLPGLQDMAGLLQRAGFALPVADIDRLTVRYDTMFHLLADLKGMGECSAFQQAAPPLTKGVLYRAAELYAEQHSDPDGRIRASFNIIYIAGWAPAASQPKPLRPGSAKVRLAEALNTKEIKF
ncbi:MAG: methyltransferase domain-containing protein [Pseudomonadota bacterium]